MHMKICEGWYNPITCMGGANIGDTANLMKSAGFNALLPWKQSVFSL